MSEVLAKRWLPRPPPYAVTPTPYKPICKPLLASPRILTWIMSLHKINAITSSLNCSTYLLHSLP